MRETVPVLIETTDDVEPSRAFDFWRSTALARVDAVQLAPDLGFAASRRVALSMPGAILHTLSKPVGVERTAHHARADGRDDIAVVVLLQGTGYLEQGNNGGLLSAGDVAFHTLDQAFSIGSRDTYEEIRFQVPRAAFLAQIGSPQAFAGRRLRATALSGLFVGYLRSYMKAVAGLSQAEAGIATEGILHLLRALADAPGERPDEGLSVDAVRALALAHIERRLHDPDFGPESLPLALRVSRSRLYAAFTGDGGVAAKIREARLDRAYRRLVALPDGGRVASVMVSSGFTDAAAFSRAFRRRFGMAPRDLLGGRAR